MTSLDIWPSGFTTCYYRLVSGLSFHLLLFIHQPQLICISTMCKSSSLARGQSGYPGKKTSFVGIRYDGYITVHSPFLPIRPPLCPSLDL